MLNTQESHKCCDLQSTLRDLGLTMTLEARWGGRGGEKLDTVQRQMKYCLAHCLAMI